MFQAQKNACYVNAKDSLEIRFSVVNDSRLVLICYTRIVEHDVQPSICLDCLVNGTFDVGFVSDVAMNVSGLMLAQRFTDGAAQLVLDIGYDYFGSMLGEDFSRAFADAARSSGYQCNLSLQPTQWGGLDLTTLAK